MNLFYWNVMLIRLIAWPEIFHMDKKMPENKKNTILLVEDDLIAALSEKMIIEKHGYRVITANSAEKALEVVAAAPVIDLILMDIDLGESVDGSVLAEQIYEKHRIPVIFISCHTEPEFIERIQGIKSYGFIVKNSTDNVLMTSIKMAFRLIEAEKLENERTEALRESEEKFRFIVENSMMPMIIASVKDYTVLFYNKYASEFFIDKSPEGTIKASDYWVRPEERDDFIRILREKGSVTGFDAELKTATGENKWCLLSAKIMNYQGQLTSFVMFNDITSRKLGEDQIKNLLSQKDMILKEVHHRIKNNMNTMISILALQADSLENPEAAAALTDAEGRFRSMQVLYDKLYRSDNQNEICMMDYLPSLIDEIISIFPAKTKLTVKKDIDEFTVNAKILQSLGILINELLTNIMKYAFTGMGTGEINFSAKLNGDTVYLAIEDNGRGMPESVNFEQSTGFGLMLVKMLTEEIGGSIRLERNGGTRISLKFKR